MGPSAPLIIYKGKLVEQKQMKIFLDRTKCKICFTHQWFIFKKNMGQFVSVKKTKPRGRGGARGRGGFGKDQIFYGFLLDPLPY